MSDLRATAIPVYIGPRRRAIARLRLRDYDRDRRRLRFFEKGGKVIWKPVPDELATMLAAAIAAGAIVEPDDYLVPPEGHLNLAGDRDDRVVWRVVKRVGDRAGVDVHVHALRAAFAVFYLEANPGDTHGLQILLGHRNPATTQIYLRKLNTETSMERVRGLSWGIQEFGMNEGVDSNDMSSSSPVVGAGGFEPPSPDSPLVERPGSQHLLLDLLDEARLAADRRGRDPEAMSATRGAEAS